MGYLHQNQKFTITNKGIGYHFKIVNDIYTPYIKISMKVDSTILGIKYLKNIIDDISMYVSPNPILRSNRYNKEKIISLCRKSITTYLKSK